MKITPLIPECIGVIFVLTALWNSFFDRQFGQWLRNWGLSPNWRYVLAGIELATALLLFSGGAMRTLGMVATPAILLTSIGICSYQEAYRKLWLSVPMLTATLYWWLAA